MRARLPLARREPREGGDRTGPCTRGRSRPAPGLLDERRIGTDEFAAHDVAIVRYHAVEEQHRRLVRDQIGADSMRVQVVVSARSVG